MRFAGIVLGATLLVCGVVLAAASVLYSLGWIGFLPGLAMGFYGIKLLRGDEG